jgi:hypothetical protein
LSTASGKVEYLNKEALEKLGAVTWWKLDGNVDDEIYENNGEEFGGVSYVECVSGEAGSFDWSSSYCKKKFIKQYLFR